MFFNSANDTLSDRKKRRLQKQIEKALNTLRSDRNNAQLQIEVAELYTALKYLQQAEKHYMAAIDILRQGNVDDKVRKQIIMLFGKILSIHPDNRRAYLQLGQEYLAAGQKEKASRFLLSSAKTAFDAEDYELALQCYNQVIAMGKSTPQIIERCAEIDAKLGRLAEAARSYLRIGDGYAQEEKYVEALDYYKKAHAVQNDNPDVILKVARMYYALKWHENAAAELVHLAAYHEQRQNYSEALKFYEHSLSLDSENEHALAGKERLTRVQPAAVAETITRPAEPRAVMPADQEDILQALDHIDLLDQPPTPAPEEDSMPVIDLTTRELEEMTGVTGEQADSKSAAAVSPTPPTTMTWQDRLLDLDVERDFILAAGLDERQHGDGATANSADDSDSTFPPLQPSTPPEFEAFLPEPDAPAHKQATRQPQGEEAMQAAHAIEMLPETTFDLTPVVQNTPLELSWEPSLELMLAHDTPPAPADFDEADHAAEELIRMVMEIEDAPAPRALAAEPLALTPAAPSSEPVRAQVTKASAVATPVVPAFEAASERPAVVSAAPELQKKLDDLEYQLQKTEEEKYFLQEQFTAQISHLKQQRVVMQNEFESANNELRTRLDHITESYETAVQQAEHVDETRYNAIITKIEHKKQLLQAHLNSVLKKRQENGRFLEEELKTLGTTKQRLQHNLAYMQQVKSRIEQKIQTELVQAHEQIQQLNRSADELNRQLQAQQQLEAQMCQHANRLKQEKEMLQDQFTETISALTEENEHLGHQLQELTAAKSKSELLLKKKLQTLHKSYHQLKLDYRASLQTKERELNDTAQRLSEFADKYLKLETTLGSIRQERDQLDGLLARETATREKLEEKMVGIEEQVNSLEVEGTALLTQLGEELDRQFGMRQQVADEFQDSLADLERLLSLQENEIHALETV